MVFVADTAGFAPLPSAFDAPGVTAACVDIAAAEGTITETGAASALPPMPSFATAAAVPGFAEPFPPVADEMSAGDRDNPATESAWWNEPIEAAASSVPLAVGVWPAPAVSANAGKVAAGGGEELVNATATIVMTVMMQNPCQHRRDGWRRFPCRRIAAIGKKCRAETGAPGANCRPRRCESCGNS